MKAFKRPVLNTQLNWGVVDTSMMKGMFCSTALIYPYVSASSRRQPKASLYAKSEITSRVKYCAMRPKSKGFIGDGEVESYFS